MKLFKKDYRKGFVRVKIQKIDDLWYLNRIIQVGDYVSGYTFRKVSVSEKEGERKRVFLKIKVEKIEFQEFSNVLKLLGVIIESGDERVPTGDHHSFLVEVNDEIIIEKEFTSVDKDYLERSKNENQISLLLVSCDYGDATFAVFHDYGLEVTGTLGEELGGKKELKSYEKNKEAFLKMLLSTVNDMSKRMNIKKILIGGASMITDTLNNMVKDYDYLKSKTSFSKVSYSGVNGIKELIRKGDVDELISSTMYSENTKIVNKLLELISKNRKSTYGFKQVKEAVIQGAVQDLIITDKLVKKMRENNTYEQLEKLISKVESTKGSVHVIPSTTEQGETIDNLTGIAAILYYNLT